MNNNLCDVNGNKLIVGAFIVYPIAFSSHLKMRTALVTEVLENEIKALTIIPYNSDLKKVTIIRYDRSVRVPMEFVRNNPNNKPLIDEYIRMKEILLDKIYNS